MTDDADDKRIMIECCHGTEVSACVCSHMVKRRWRKVGFIENSSDPDDLQAWCEKCERLFLDEGSMTERFRAFTDMKLVCTTCYAEIKAKHSR